MRGWVAIYLACCLLAAGCACRAPLDGPALEERQSAFSDITDSMRGCLRHHPEAVNLASRELLELCVRPTNPQLYDLMCGYQFHAVAQGKRVGVVMCDPAGARALMEDLSCTPHVDQPYYSDGRAPACRNHLDPAKDCP